MRARTIKGSPGRSALAAWAEIDRMIAETLAPAPAIDDSAVRAALGMVSPLGPMLVAGGVLVGHPIVLRALPLQLEVTIALGNAALSDDERLGKVPGAATATDWGIYLPDPDPWAAQVRAAVAGHAALHAGAAPAEAAPAAPKASRAVAPAAIDPNALGRISGGAP